jgi:hypothetical protein
MHLVLDAGSAIFLMASPWLFGFANRIYGPHVLFGVFELIVGAMSRTSRSADRLTRNASRAAR